MTSATSPKIPTPQDAPTRLDMPKVAAALRHTDTVKPNALESLFSRLCDRLREPAEDRTP